MISTTQLDWSPKDLMKGVKWRVPHDVADGEKYLLLIEVFMGDESSDNVMRCSEVVIDTVIFVHDVFCHEHKSAYILISTRLEQDDDGPYIQIHPRWMYPDDTYAKAHMSLLTLPKSSDTLVGAIQQKDILQELVDHPENAGAKY